MENNIQPLPKTYLAEAIIVTLMCCMPLGIVAIIHASGVTGAYYRGNYAEAYRKSQQAGRLVKLGFVLGVVYVMLLSVLIIISAFLASEGVFKSHPGM